MPYLINTVQNSFITAPAGMEVFIKADQTNMMIVENKEGVRFSVRADNLSEEFIAAQPLPVIEQQPIVAVAIVSQPAINPSSTPPKSASKSANINPQQSKLF